MHELSTCKSLIQQTQKAIADYSACKIKSITVLIGELARVDVDELIELFPLASKGTIAENAELIVKREPAIFSCNDCHLTSHSDGCHFICSHCQSHQLTLISGVDMILDNIELEQN